MKILNYLFPIRMRKNFEKDFLWEGLEEIRVRIGQPVEFLYGDRFAWVGEEVIVSQDIQEMLNYISSYSLFAYREEMKQGFITIEGGHRIGIAGQATLQEGKITGICPVGFLNIRVAHEKKGVAREIFPFLNSEEQICNVLILSPPGCGKTTLLRDIVRGISSGCYGGIGKKVGVVDERSEIAASYRGMPQNDLGPRTDVLDGCPKRDGIILLLRAMSPQVIAVDELGTEEDFRAVGEALHCGCKVVATVHAENIAELGQKHMVRKWMGQGLFQRYVQIKKEQNGNRKLEVYGEKLERIC